MHVTECINIILRRNVFENRKSARKTTEVVKLSSKSNELNRKYRHLNVHRWISVELRLILILSEQYQIVLYKKKFLGREVAVGAPTLYPSSKIGWTIVTSEYSLYCNLCPTTKRLSIKKTYFITKLINKLLLLLDGEVSNSQRLSSIIH